MVFLAPGGGIWLQQSKDYYCWVEGHTRKYLSTTNCSGSSPGSKGGPEIKLEVLSCQGSKLRALRLLPEKGVIGEVITMASQRAAQGSYSPSSQGETTLAVSRSEQALHLPS